MISVIIPTFNSSKYLEQCLNSLIKCKSINEIVISDDFSDSEDLLNLKKIIFNHQLKNKIKLYENNINKGAYRNKLDSVKKASSDLVYILDSDNIAGFNLENILYKISKIDDETSDIKNYSPLLSLLIEKIKVDKEVNVKDIIDKIGFNFKIGEYTNEGFHFKENLGISIQYKDGYNTFKAIEKLVKFYEYSLTLKLKTKTSKIVKYEF